MNDMEFKEELSARTKEVEDLVRSYLPEEKYSGGSIHTPTFLPKICSISSKRFSISSADVSLNSFISIFAFVRSAGIPSHISVNRYTSRILSFIVFAIRNSFLQIFDDLPCFIIKFSVSEIILFIFFGNLPNDFTRISCCNRPVRNVLCYNTSAADNNVISDMYAW